MRPLMAIALVLAGTLGILVWGANRPDEAERLPPPYSGDAEESEFLNAQKSPANPPAGDRNLKEIAFDGDKAMRHLADICAIGPRMSGTQGMQRQQDLLRKHFAGLKLEAKLQPFSAKQTSVAKPVDMANLIVSFDPGNKKRAILCSHYDTRPIADQEPDRRRWKDPFVSANDGGSGVALLMEFARHLPKLDLQVGVDLVFFDGEEYIFERDGDRYFFGSQHFATSWRKLGKDRPDYYGAVLLDMVAGKKARFPVEGHSYRSAKSLSIALWNIAKQQGCDAFVQEVGDTVLDDHLSLLNVGIPAVDIIDFRYPHWHRVSDVPENCDPEGMVQVARVLAAWLQTLR